VASSNNLADIVEESVLHVLPSTKTIAVVIGTSPNEAFWLQERRRETARLAGRVQFRWYNELSFEDILKDAAALPSNSAIYWQFINVDAAGVAHEGLGALNRLSAAANAPIFTHDGPYFGEGIVGGPMQSVAEMGKKTGEVALRILDGEKPGDIKPSFVTPGSPLFDWRQMQRWGIAESSLPPGSTVYFREPTAWERYWWQIALAISLILVQAGLILLLLNAHRRRRLAEVQSAQRTKELAHVNRFSMAGELTASIAHEINQPLGSILTNAETAKAILKSPTPDIAELNEIVDDILHDDRRASEFIRRMRSLLKKAPFEPHNFDLNEVVREAVDLLSAVALGRKVELRSFLAPIALPIIISNSSKSLLTWSSMRWTR
jgi:His Kinase A (phospho-acceptor) domain/ABC transporter substrate binding protein